MEPKRNVLVVGNSSCSGGNPTLFSCIFHNKSSDIGKIKEPHRGNLQALPEPLVGLPQFQRILARVMESNAGIIGFFGVRFGVGLTTLLHYLNNQFILKPDHPFDHVFFCPGASSTRKVSEMIAVQLGVSDKVEWRYERDYKVKARILLKELEGKRYALLMDDSDSPFTPSEIGVPPPINGSKFIFMAESNIILNENKPDISIKLEPLSDLDSVYLFTTILGLRKTMQSKGFAYQMVPLTFNLPKVIVVVASLMKRNKTTKHWQNELYSMKVLHDALSVGISRFRLDFAEDFYFNINFERQLAANKIPKSSKLAPGLGDEEGKRLLAVRRREAK